MRIIIMGPQGSGKSTQAKLLAKELNLPHISTGEIFRNLKNTKSALGARVARVLEEGKLVSDDDTMKVIGNELSKEAYKKGFVLDGFPRNLFQAKNAPFSPDVVFYLKVSDNEAKKRLLLRKREDDKPNVIKERLKEYHLRTEPVLDFYLRKGKLISIPGEKKIEEIHNLIIKEVRRFKGSRNA